MNKLKIIIIIAVIAVIGITVVISQKKTNSSGIYYGEAVGTSFNVSTTSSGLLDSIHVYEGDLVNVNQLIATLRNDDIDYQIELAKKQAEIASLQLFKGTTPARVEELNILKNKIKTLEGNQEILANSYKSANSALSEANLSKNLASDVLVQKQLEYDDTYSLYNGGVVSKSTLDNALLSLKTAQKNYDASILNQTRLSEELASIKKQTGLLSIEIDSAKQTLHMATTGLDEYEKNIAELTLENAELTIKRLEDLAADREISTLQSGIVETINYEVGEFIAPGTPIMTLYNPDELTVKIYVHERDLTTFNVGDVVSISAANNDHIDHVDGKIIHIANHAMFTPLNIVTVEDRERLVFEVKLSLNRSDYLRPGMLLKIDLQGGN